MLESLGSFFAHLLFWSALALSIIIIPFGLPGTFVIVGTVFLYGLITSFAVIKGSFVIVLLIIAGLGELIEFFFGAASAKKFGGSKYSMWGAIIGSFIGAIWGSGVAPIVGTLIGAFLGAFLGAAGAEFLVAKNLSKAIHVGVGAFLGTLGGKITKIIIGISMVALTIGQFF